MLLDGVSLLLTLLLHGGELVFVGALLSMGREREGRRRGKEGREREEGKRRRRGKGGRRMKKRKKGGTRRG